MADFAPIVNGISPKEGSPGTKLTIRGENLGRNTSDLIEVTICGQDCTQWAEWVTSKKIMCRTSREVGQGEVIVTTKSGGRGKCEVHFRGLPPPVSADPFLEMDHWEDEPEDILDTRTLLSPGPVTERSIVNPLGLSVDEARSGPTRGMSKPLPQQYPGKSGSLLADEFSAEWLLLERYRVVEFEDLKAGLAHLDGEMSRRSVGTTSFIKGHVGSFIQCYDVLTAVNEALVKSETAQLGGILTDKAEDGIKNACELADKVYEVVLSYRKKADTIRNALAVLQRYRFLFNLPKNIERNISSGDYDFVANDYERAKSLFTGTKVTVFQKVLDKVEEQIEEVRVQLRRKLEQLPAPLDEQKKLIKYLLELDCGGDPAWECIRNMHEWILKLMQSCRASYQPAGEGDRSQVLKKQESVRTSENEDMAFAMTRNDIERPKQILFVEELTGLISENLPDLWNLGCAYLSKSLYQDIGIELSEEQFAILNRIETNRNEFLMMVNEVVEFYSDMVHLVFFPDHWSRIPEEQKELFEGWTEFSDPIENARPWLTTCVREINSCLSLFESIELPTATMRCTSLLLFNMRQHCMEVLFNHASLEIKSLHEREDWNVQAEEGGCITSLPLMIENIVVELLLNLEEVVVHQGKGEEAKTLWEDSEVLLGQLLQNVTHCLSYLAFEQEHDLHEEAMSKLANPQGSQDLVSALGEAVDDSQPHSDQRLVMVLSNCHYIQTQIVPRIFDCFRAHKYPSAEKTEKMVVQELGALDVKVFDEYIDRKQQPLLGILEAGMYVGSFDWEECPKVKRVRTYIRELLMTMVYIHNEVHAISSQFVKRVIARLLDIIAQEMLKMLEEAGTFSMEGAMHAYVEVTTLKRCLNEYTTPDSVKAFSDAVRLTGVLEVQDDESRGVKTIIERFIKGNSLQLKCFSPS
jgi:exocyst complex component 2